MKKYLRPLICLSSTTDNRENPIKILNTLLCLPLTLVVLVCDADCCWATMDNSIISDRQQTSWWWWWWLTGAETITRSREQGAKHCRYLQVSGPVCGPSPASNKQLYWCCLWLCPHNLPASHVPARLGSGQLFSSCYKLYCCYLSVSSSVVIKQSSLHINWFVRQNSWYKQYWTVTLAMPWKECEVRKYWC